MPELGLTGNGYRIPTNKVWQIILDKKTTKKLTQQGLPQ